MSAIKVYNTEANALAGGSSGLIPANTVGGVAGVVSNSEDSIPYYVYERYYYRIEANEPVIEFHIDWDDGEDNSEDKRNLQIIKFKTPRTFCVVDHVYTKNTTFYPLVRVKSIDGYLSKLYTHFNSQNFANNRLTPLEPTTVSAGQNEFSQVSLHKADSAQVPQLQPSALSPVAILKSDRKRVFAGIDNKHIDKIALANGYPLLYAYSEMSSGTQPIVKLTLMHDQKQIKEYTITAANVLTGDSSSTNSATSDLAVKHVPFGNYNDGSATTTNHALLLVKAELLNAKKLSDTQRIYINVVDATTSANVDADVSEDKTVCILSNGNPIVDLNDPFYRATVDGSESFAREFNNSVDSYLFDDGSIPDRGDRDSISSQAIQAVSNNSGNINQFTDGLVTTTVSNMGGTPNLDLSYTHGSHGHYKDSDSRFYNFSRLVRLQVISNNSLDTNDVVGRHSVIEHYGKDRYTSTLDSGVVRCPLSEGSEALILYSNADGESGGENTGAWSDLGAAAITNQLMFGGDGSGAKLQNQDDANNASGGPDNFLLVAKTETFDKIHIRTSHLNLFGDTPTEVSLSGWYATGTEWKPLELNDETNGLKASGTISWRKPSEWSKVRSNTINSGNWNGPVIENDSGSSDPESLWDFNAYGILIGIGIKTAEDKIVVTNVWPCDNQHSQVISVIDPHHVSLNDIAIAQSISFNRQGKFQTLEDRFGKSEIRKMGANGGIITFGSVDLGDINSQGNRKIIKQYQQNATPVFLDVPHRSGEITRFFGVIIAMSEDHPVGNQFPKYAIRMQISHIIEMDSTGGLLSDKISIGGKIDDARKFFQ